MSEDLLSDVTVDLDFMLADSGKGLTNVDKESLELPRLIVLQAKTPAADEDSDSYIDGAKAGMFYNTATQELYGDSVQVIPLMYTRNYNHWGVRDTPEEGYKGTYQLDDPFVLNALRDNKRDDRGRLLVLDCPDTTLENTFNFLVRVKTPTGWSDPIHMPFSSSLVSDAKRWIAYQMDKRVSGADGRPKLLPSFSHVYTLSSYVRKKDKHTWKGIKADKGEPITSKALYLDARSMSSREEEDNLLSASTVAYALEGDVVEGEVLESEEM